MKANLDDCMLIKKYHRELTDAAIRLIRKAHKIVLDFKDIWNLEDEDDSFLFTNPNNDYNLLSHLTTLIKCNVIFHGI
jgi:hypothetical protein